MSSPAAVIDEEKLPTPEVAAVALSMRIPHFWRERPRLWFISFEAVTGELKKGQAQLAQMVIANLERQDIEQISDILFSPPEKPYDSIKERLISAYEESDSRQFQKLLSEMELGDQKPSQLLRRMRDLARDKVPDKTLRFMWTNHLPSHIRSVLAVSESFSSKAALDELAQIADKMLEQSQEVTSVSAISPSTSSSTHQTDHQYLLAEIRKMSLEIAELKAAKDYTNYRRPFRRFTTRNRSSSQSHSRTRSTSPAHIPQLCYYHRKFGSQARRCTTPCNYAVKTSSHAQPEN